MTVRSATAPNEAARGCLDPARLAAGLDDIPWIPEFDAVHYERVVITNGGFDVYFDLLHPGGGATRLIASTTVADPEETARHARYRLQRRKRAQLASVDSPGVSAVPRLGLVVRRAGLDERLVGLDLLHHPERAASIAHGHVGAVDRVELLSHRLGKRAVLRVVGTSTSIIVKLAKPRSDDATRTTELAMALRSTHPGLVPEPLLTLPDRSASVWEDIGDHRGDQWGPLPDTLDREHLGSTLRALHDLEIPDRPVHSTSAEAAILERALSLLRRVRPACADRHAGEVQRAQRALSELTHPGPPGFVHRDLHPGQIVSTSSGLRLLDLDTATAGDPALDLGNLIAHLEARGDHDDAAAVAAGYAPSSHTRERLDTWTAAAATRIRLQRCAVGEAGHQP